MATTNIQSFAGQVEVNSNLTVNTNTLHVDSVAGRVGIGKTDPSYAMDVNGTVNATALYVDGSEFVSELWTESGSNIYYTGGNVGIGTTAPQKTLEVAGPMRITDGLSNVCDLSVGTGSWGFQSKITAPASPNPALHVNDFFGKSVSISSDGSYALVGAYRDDDVTPESGSAYIFSRSGTGWTFQSKITAPDPGPNDYFGTSVSISGDGSYAIAGANQRFTGYGYADIFSRAGTSWTFQSKITAPDPVQGDQFGYSVSISGDGSYAIAGAWKDDRPGQPTDDHSGSAYIFSRSGSTWAYQSKITAPDAATQDLFGSSVSISSDGSYVIVGAYRDSIDPFTFTGSAYIFSRSGSTWTYQSKITAPDPGPGTSFGYSVAISGDGSYAIAGLKSYGGAAYIFSRSGSTWTHQSKITAPDLVGGDYFGSSVSISSDGSYAIAGAYGDDDS